MNPSPTSPPIHNYPPRAETAPQQPAGNARLDAERPAQLAHHAIAPVATNPRLNRCSRGHELRRLKHLDDEAFGANIMELINAGRQDLLEQVPRPWFFAANHDPEIWSERVRYGTYYYRCRRSTLLHYAIEQKKYACLRVLAEKLPELISLEDQHCLTPVQLAAAKGDVNSIQIIAGQDPHCLTQTNFVGHTALWKAIQEGQLDAIRYIVRNWPCTAQCLSYSSDNTNWYDYPSLYALAFSKKINRQILQFFCEKTPRLYSSRARVRDLLCSMVNQKNEDCLRWLFTLKTTRQMLQSISSCQYFAELSIRLPSLFHELQARYLLPAKPIRGFDLALYQAELRRLATSCWPINQSLSGITEMLDLNTQNTGTELLHTAKAFLAVIGHVGIQLNVTMYTEEAAANRTYASLGDLSASVRMMERLIDLGAKKISLFIAITSPSNRMESDSNALQLGMNKLGLLLSASEPLSHGLSMDRRGCKVNMICLNKLPIPDSVTRQPQKELPAVIMSFSVVTEQFININKFYDTDNSSFITIRPYDFYKGHEFMLTDIHSERDRANSIPLHLPQHSVIPLSAASLVENDDNIAPGSSTRHSDVARQSADKLCTMVKSQRLHMSVIYGIHCPDSEVGTLTLWLQAIKLQLKESRSSHRPVMIVVFPNNSPEVISALNVINMDLNIPMLDMDGQSAINQLDQLGDGEVFIAKMPSLPRATFNRLINSSDYPTLSEGANLTSFLLQTGHPYLSVLPAGNTAIPQNIGDALEAMKSKALSCKLRILSNDPDKIKLEEIWQKIHAKHYAQALAIIDELKESNDYYNLGFLWDRPADNNRPVASITVATLLQQFDALSKDGEEPSLTTLEAVKAAVDPTLNCYVDFLNSCRDQHSTTVNHARLMQQHTCQPGNCALSLAITKFLQHKGVPCSLTDQSQP